MQTTVRKIPSSPTSFQSSLPIQQAALSSPLHSVNSQQLLPNGSTLLPIAINTTSSNLQSVETSTTNPSDNSNPSKTTAHTGDDDNDPLESFMKTLSESAVPLAKRIRPSSTLADFERSDSPSLSDTLNANLSSGNQKTRPKRVYERVDHSKIDYPPFEKNLYIPVPELISMTNAQVISLRRSLDNIRVRGRHCPYPISAWAQCGLSNALLSVLRRYEYNSPTPIQAQAIPCVMNGRDVIGIARTGSGKTLAFLLPLFRHIARRPRAVPGDGPSALVIAPTRELAIQIYRETKRFTKALSIHSVCAYGGNGLKDQIAELKRGADVIICTPGRMIDLLAMNSGRLCNLRRVSFVVLDEADRMFDMGFEPQLTRIVENIRPDRQTVMFSATFPMQVEKLARKVLHSPIEIQVGGNSVASSTIDQHIEVRSEDSKFFRLLELLGQWYEKGSTLVFVDRQDNADRIFRELSKARYKCLSLHGGMDQADRDSTIVDFKNGDVKVLVATSVAARGLDVKNLTLVINYDVPSHYEDYVHRVGRTGRAGRSGTAHTFITPDQESFASDLVKALEKSARAVAMQDAIDSDMDKENLKKTADSAAEMVVPDDLRRLAQSFALKRKAGIVKYGAKSGYGGRGFKFEEDDDEYHANKTAIRKMQAKLYGIDDEVVGLDEDEDEDAGGAGHDGDNVDGERHGQAKKNDDDKEEGSDDDIVEVSVKTGVNVTAHSRAVSKLGGVTAKQQQHLGLSVGNGIGYTSEINKKLSDEEIKQLLLEATQKAEEDANAQNMDGYQKRGLIAKAKLQVLSLATMQGGSGTGGTDTNASISNQFNNDDGEIDANGLDGSEINGEGGGVRYAGELQINDFPSNARWQVLRKGALADVEEFTGCVVTTRGKYYAPGRNPPAGERKLHFLIEGPSRSAVKMARRDIKQKLEEASALSRSNDNQYTKYSVV